MGRSALPVRWWRVSNKRRWKVGGRPSQSAHFGARPVECESVREDPLQWNPGAFCWP